MPKLELEGVVRTYPGEKTPALCGVDFSVDEGEVLVLVGPSGCGKSTVLRLIAGLDEPDAGNIRLDGGELWGVPPQERDVAMVFQGYALYPHMTVRENIAFPLKMRGMSRARCNERVNEVTEFLEIDLLLARRPGELSGGERQRVAMARALVRRPKLFLFDEPLSNLDASLRTTLRVEIAALLRKLKATAIYVTHDQVEAMTVGHRIAVMTKGMIAQVGSPRSIYDAPADMFVAGFLGTPPINMLPADVSGEGPRLLGSPLRAPRGLELSDQISIGVRPEHVRVRPSDDVAPVDHISFIAKVTVTEPLGPETVLHCHAQDLALRAKVPGFFDSALGDEVRVSIDPADVLWFDRGTEKRLLAPGPAKKAQGARLELDPSEGET